jgi:hypothetical protein
MAREILYRVIYGTGQFQRDPTKAYLASQLKIQPAILHGYCRHQVQWADYPGIIPQDGHTVRGTYVTGLTEGDIWRLDRFEGSEYTLMDVKVELLKEGGDVAGDGSAEEHEVKTKTYVYTAGNERLEKEEWDYEEFRKEKMHNWTDESFEYEGES